MWLWCRELWAGCRSLAGNRCSAAGRAGQGKAGLDLVQGSRHGMWAGVTVGIASRHLGCGGWQHVPQGGTALGLYTQQACTLEEVSDQTQHLVLVQGIAGRLAG